MQNSVSSRVLSRIKNKGCGWVFTPKDFLDLGTRTNIDFILHQLKQKQAIRRISSGIYDFPIKHPKLGILSPPTSGLLRAVVVKTGESIQLSGAEAANLLGLSTQVPSKPIYLTSGRSRSIHIGGEIIKLKHTSIKPLHGKGDKVSLVVQALRYIGKDNIDDRVIQICTKQLSKKQKDDLRLMAARVPAWLIPILHNIATNPAYAVCPILQ